MSNQDKVLLRSGDDKILEVDEWVVLESQTNKVDEWVVLESQTNKVWLKSSDDEMFAVDELVALQSQTLKNMIENNESNTVIPLPNVTSRILAMVIKYCTYHMELDKNSNDEKQTFLKLSEIERFLHMQKNSNGEKPTFSDDKIKQWDAEFVNVDQATLFELISAANYLKIKKLLELTCGTVVDMIKGKSPQEIMRIFAIKKDYTLKEDEEIRRMIKGNSPQQTMRRGEEELLQKAAEVDDERIVGVFEKAIPKRGADKHADLMGRM